MSNIIPRNLYADMYGPTKGDKVRLADTELIIEVEEDFTTYGEEIKFGGGNGGHNGLSNIDQMIGNNYYRLRVGIDHPGEKNMVSNYVLNKFTEEETNIIDKKLDLIKENFNLVFDNSSLFLTKLAN